MREMCWRCRRPRGVCWCAHLPALAPRTEVVLLQHPRERHMPIGTARMTHLALAGSRLVEGVAFDDDARVSDLFDGDTVVLALGESAVPLTQLARAPRRLVLIDGTWAQAQKILRQSPRLAALPRVAIAPTSPGRYLIRKEPSDQHLSTIEAAAEALGVLEGDAARYAALLRPFDAMVTTQLACAHAGRHTRPRHERRADRRAARGAPRARFDELTPVLADLSRAVVLYVEVNATPGGERCAGVPEPVHIVARRLEGHGDDLSVIVRPRAGVHDGTLMRLGLTRAEVDAGVAVAAAIAAVDDRMATGDRLLTWGAFPRDALAAHGGARRGFIDLRGLCCRLLGGAAGGLDVAARRLGHAEADGQRPRAVRMSDAAMFVAGALVEEARAVSADLTRTPARALARSPASAR